MPSYCYTVGFTEVQSKGLVAVLVQICLQQNDRVLVQPRDLNVLELQIKRDIEQISHNQTLLEKSNISQLRDAAKELEKEIEQLKVLLKDEVKKVENGVKLLKDEVKKVENGVKLDINLERGRNKENETLVEQKIKDTHNMISTEVALLKISMETNKLDLLKYLTGSLTLIIPIIVI
jgi:hypothetical protein